MRTLTTVENVERKASGAIVVTFLGGNRAGTYDAAIGDEAEKALAEDHSVELQVDKRDGKVFIERLEIIYPPEELGGPPESGTVEAAALVAPFAPAVAAAEADTEQGDDTTTGAMIAAAELTGATIRDADGFIVAIGRIQEQTPTPMQLAAKLNEVIEFLNQGEVA